jgi:hypothetical protein
LVVYRQNTQTMPAPRLIFFVLLTALIYGCDKDANYSEDCENFKSALVQEDVAKVKELVHQFIIQSAALTHTRENLEKLASFISRNCDITATVFCYACIDTLPGQSEIILRFRSGVSQVVRVLDLWNRHDDNKMIVRNVHQ